MQEQQPSSIFEEKLTPGLQNALFAISRWSRLISVIGFGIGAFVVVMMFLSGATIFKQMQEYIGMNMQGIYGALIVVFFIFFFIVAAVLYFLYKASMLLQQGVQQKDTTLIAEGFVFLKRFFLITAILGALSLLANIVTLFK